MNNLNRIVDLSPLAGMPLRELDLSNCSMVSSLDPLRGLPLEVLHLAGTGSAVSTGIDMEIFRGAPLRVLSLPSNRARHLEALAGCPIEELDVPNSMVDLEFARGFPLRTVDVAHARSETPPLDIAALRGKPLDQLFLRNRKLADPLVLVDMQVRSLNWAIPDAERRFVDLARRNPRIERYNSHYHSEMGTWIPRAGMLALHPEEWWAANTRAVYGQEPLVHQGSRYRLVNQPMSVGVAADLAEAVGGHLVSLESPEEFGFVVAALRAAKFSASATGGRLIGGTTVSWASGRTTQVPAAWMGATSAGRPLVLFMVDIPPRQRATGKPPPLLGFPEGRYPFVIEWPEGVDADGPPHPLRPRPDVLKEPPNTSDEEPSG